MNDDTQYEVVKYTQTRALAIREEDWSGCVGCVLVKSYVDSGADAWKPIRKSHQCTSLTKKYGYGFFSNGCCFTESSELRTSFTIEPFNEIITGDPRVEGNL